MINKNILIITLIFIVLTLSVYGTTYGDLNNYVIVYYEMEEDSSPLIDSSGNNIDLAGSITGNITGIIKGGNDFESTSSNRVKSTGDNVLKIADIFFSVWVRAESSPANSNTIFSTYHNDGGSKGFDLFWRNDDKIWFSTYGGGGYDLWETNTALNFSQWYHISGYFDDTSGDIKGIWINGNKVGSLINNGSSSLDYHSSTCLSVGGNSEGCTVGWFADEFDGYIDELYIGNVDNDSTGSSIQDLVDFLYDDGSPGEEQQYIFQTPDLTPPNISIYYPINTTHYNNFNKSIYVNCTDNIACTYCNLSGGWVNYGEIGNLWYFNKTTVGDGNYSSSAFCKDNANNNNTVDFWFVVDTVNPIITLNLPILNYRTNLNFSLDIDYSDNYLWKTNTTIYKNVSLYYNNYSGELGGATTIYNITNIIDITNMTDGNYTLLMESTDTHTNKEFKENINEHKTCIGFECSNFYELDESEFIIIFPNSLIIESIKDYDRFKFKFSEKEGKEIGKIKIKIKSSHKLKYLYDSPYSCHFIFKNYWFDLEPLECIVSKISDNEFELEVEINKVSIITESLGGLNYINSTSYFIIDTTPPNITTNTTSSTDSTIELNFSTSENVTVKWKFGLNCNGLTLGNESYADNFSLSRTALFGNVTHYYNITLNDTLHTTTYCINLTTLPTFTGTGNTTGILIDTEDINFVSLILVGFLIYLLLLAFSIKYEDYYVFYFSLFLSVVIGVWIFKESNLPTLIPVVFILFNIYMFFKIQVINKEL